VKRHDEQEGVVVVVLLGSERPLQVRDHLAERGGVAGAGEPARRRHPEETGGVDDEAVVAAPVDDAVEPPGAERLALGVVAVGRRREHVLGAAAGVVRVRARHGAGRAAVRLERAVEAQHLRRRRRLRLVAVVERVVGRLHLHRLRPARDAGLGSRGRRLDAAVVVHRVVPLDHALLVVDPAQHPVVQLRRQ
jgi:hypothetical protein